LLVLLGALCLASVPAAMQVPPDPPEVPDPGSPTAPPSLKTVPVVLPSNLFDAVEDFDAAVRLGKALFWDQQVGSDGMACASCHFQAGADNRIKNQINPGPGDAFGTFYSRLGRTELHAAGLRLPVPPPGGAGRQRVGGRARHRRPHVIGGREQRDPAEREPGMGADTGMIFPDANGFHIGNTNVRRVEPRNTPTVLNSIFLHRIFFDGRANFFFNGLNPSVTPTPTRRCS
jgi:hypothetical protein